MRQASLRLTGRHRWVTTRTPVLMILISILLPVFNLFRSSSTGWKESDLPDLQYLLLPNSTSSMPLSSASSVSYAEFVSHKGVPGGAGAQQQQGPAEELTSNPVTSALQSTSLSRHAVVELPRQVAELKAGKGSLGKTFSTKVPVVVWPLWEMGTKTAASRHMEQNGIDESPFLELSNNASNFDPNVVWIGDTGYGFGWRVWCSKFQHHVHIAQTQRAQRGLPTSWPIYIVDWTDYDSQQRCPDIERLVGPEFVFYAQRGIVGGRRWNSTKGWVDLGHRICLNATGRPIYRHTPFIVRTDIVENLQRALQRRGLRLSDRLERVVPRPVDVTHLWPLNVTHSGVGGVGSQLRVRVSQIVARLGSRPSGTVSGWNVFVGLAGDAARGGRQGVSDAYVDALLATKIVVVTQRDMWEDHYRLFEALVSGAMVMTDRMLSLPVGFRNGTSLIEFESEEELIALLQHYLARPEERFNIAREGRLVAMSRHRSWHRMEEIIFGAPLSTCDWNAINNCSYQVHANETWN